MLVALSGLSGIICRLGLWSNCGLGPVGIFLVSNRLLGVYLGTLSDLATGVVIVTHCVMLLVWNCWSALVSILGSVSGCMGQDPGIFWDSGFLVLACSLADIPSVILVGLSGGGGSILGGSGGWGVSWMCLGDSAWCWVGILGFLGWLGLGGHGEIIMAGSW